MTKNKPSEKKIYAMIDEFANKVRARLTSYGFFLKYNNYANGNCTSEYYCHKCGHHHKIAEGSRRKLDEVDPKYNRCPNCNNDDGFVHFNEMHYTYSTKEPFRAETDRYVEVNMPYVEEFDGGFNFAFFTIRYGFYHQKFIDRKPKITCHPLMIGRFDASNGLHVKHKFSWKAPDKDYETVTGYDAYDKVKNLYAKLKKEEDDVWRYGRWGDWGDRERWIFMNQDRRDHFDKCMVQMEQYAKACPDGLRACYKAKTRFEGLFNADKNSPYKTDTSVIVFENTDLPDNDLLIRCIDIEGVDAPWNNNRAICEYRLFCGPKLRCYKARLSYRHDETYESISTDDFHLNFDVVFEQTNEEIAEVIKNSYLKYSGLLEYYGLAGSDCPEYSEFDYIFDWYKQPGIELLLKARMTNMLQDVICGGAKLKKAKTAKNIAELLGVSKSMAKIAIKNNFGKREINELIKLYEADNSLTEEVYQAIKQLDIDSVYFVEIKAKYDISYTKAMEYLEEAYQYQYIKKKEAIVLWSDYLRMATDLGIDLSDKSRKFPDSLKKTHDMAIFMYEAFEKTREATKFADQAEKNAAKYEYSYKGLMAVVPKTREEVVKEASRQKNCLLSYVERIAEGTTTVVFIRRTSAPEETYVTAEVRDGKMLQLKGYCNSDPRDEELMDFVNHWVAEKGIKVAC